MEAAEMKSFDARQMNASQNTDAACAAPACRRAASMLALSMDTAMLAVSIFVFSCIYGILSILGIAGLISIVRIVISVLLLVVLLYKFRLPLCRNQTAGR